MSRYPGASWKELNSHFSALQSGMWYNMHIQNPPRSANCRGNGRDLVERCDVHSIPHASGIYQILCVPTGKVYIGSSNDLNNRYRQHFVALKSGTHANTYLQRAYSRYGHDAFVFSILELVPIELLIEREQYWMDATQCCLRSRGFNRVPKAGSNTGFKRSAVLRAADSARAKERMSRPGMREAVSKVHSGKTISDSHRARVAEAARKRQLTSENKASLIAKAVGRYIAIDPAGTVYEVVNLKAFCQEHGLNYGSVKSVAREQGKSRTGWRFQRIELPERLR